MNEHEFLKNKYLKKSRKNPLLNSLAKMLSKNFMLNNDKRNETKKNLTDSVENPNFYRIQTEGMESEKKYSRVYSKKRGSLRDRNKFLNRTDDSRKEIRNDRNKSGLTENFEFVKRDRDKRGSLYNLGKKKEYSENPKIFFAEFLSSKNAENLVSITKKTKNFRKKTKDEKFEEWEEMIKLNLNFKQKDRNKITTETKQDFTNINVYSNIPIKKNNVENQNKSKLSKYNNQDLVPKYNGRYKQDKISKLKEIKVDRSIRYNSKSKKVDEDKFFNTKQHKQKKSNIEEKIEDFFKKYEEKKQSKNFPLKKYFLSPLISALKSDIRKESKRHDYFNQLRISHLKQTFLSINKIKNIDINKTESLKQIKLNGKKFTSNKDYFLILDLDETLVHISKERKNTDAYTLKLDFCNEIVYLHKRPFLNSFLENIYKKFNLIIYTASQKNYADIVIDKIDPENKYFIKRLYRENCKVYNQNFIFKDINSIKNINLSKTIFIDNSIISLFFNFENSLQILPFLGHKMDLELKTLLHFLKAIYYKKDFRNELISTYRLDLILNTTNYDDLVKLFLSL